MKCVVILITFQSPKCSDLFSISRLLKWKINFSPVILEIGTSTPTSENALLSSWLKYCNNT